MSLERRVRAAFVAASAAVAGVAAAIDHEPAELPEQLGDGAVVAMLGLPPAQRDTGTGISLVTYTWRVTVYVNLPQGYDVAQFALADVLEAVLAITRDDPDAGGLVDQWTLTGGGQEPQFAHKEGWIFQPLTLTAEVEQAD